MDLLVPDLDRPVHGDVQKIAVVRDQHVGERIIRQIRFQPVARFQIQVIGRLVEQQHVGLFEQQLRQRDAHLPAARKLLGAAGPIFLAKPEPVEHRAHLRLDRVAVAIAEFAYRCDADGRPRLHIRRSPGRARPACDAAFPAPAPSRAARRKRSCIRRRSCARKASGRPAADSPA